MTFVKSIAQQVLMISLAFLAGACSPGSSVLPANREELLRQSVSIPGGEYEIGSREPGSWPVQRVQLAPFYIWPTEVTVAWWQAFKAQSAGTGEEALRPVTEVTYDDAVAFCAWLSEKTGARVRLPTTAEWLVAAQAGSPGMAFPWGWGVPEGRAVFSTNATMPVARFAPNAYGLYDVSGNAAEWAAADNPITAPVMGGSWAEQNADYLRISSQMILPRMYKGKDTGFRIVIDP